MDNSEAHFAAASLPGGDISDRPIPDGDRVRRGVLLIFGIGLSLLAAVAGVVDVVEDPGPAIGGYVTMAAGMALPVYASVRICRRLMRR
jgi:hypothetical protein